MKCYAAGVVGALVRGGVAVETIKIAVIQPKVYDAPQEISLSFDELGAWLLDVFVPGCEATREPDATLVPGEKQCEWCRAKATCPALAQHALEAVALDPAEFADLTTPPAPLELDSAFLATVVLKAPIIKQWLEACQAEAQRRAMEGEALPKLKLVRGRKGNRQWMEEQETSITDVLRNNCGLATESMYKLSLLSPAQLMKLPEVKGKEHLLAAFIEQKEGAITLVPESAKGDPVTPDALSIQFDSIS
jgi:hypothetical protein